MKRPNQQSFAHQWMHKLWLPKEQLSVLERMVLKFAAARYFKDIPIMHYSTVLGEFLNKNQLAFIHQHWDTEAFLIDVRQHISDRVQAQRRPNVC